MIVRVPTSIYLVARMDMIGKMFFSPYYMNVIDNFKL